MVDYNKLRMKFPSKSKKKGRNSAAIKAIAREFEMKKAELGLDAPIVKRGFPYYMAIIIGLLVVGGLVGTAISKNGGIDIAGKNREKAVKSIKALAVALGRYRYHTGKFPTTDEGLEQLASKSVTLRGWNGPYVRKVNLDPWKHEYEYVYNGESKPPTLYSRGPDGAAGTTDDIIADPSDYDLAFRDTSWTKEWVPMHLRDIVVAQDENHKRQLEEELRQILHPEIPVEGDVLLDGGWEFRREDAPDSQWTKTRVPHDWTVSRGFETSGRGRYRRLIEIPSKASGKRMALRFAAVAGAPTVYFNGVKLYSCGYGAGSFEVDVSGMAVFAVPNILEVEIDAPPPADGQAPGAGISGNVTLSIEDATDRIVDGTLKVDTLELGDDIAKMRISYDTPSGAVTNCFDISGPRVWTCDRPFLYKGYLCGRMHQYAVRTLSFDAGACRLNGEPLELRGVDFSTDMGPLGSAWCEYVARRRLQAMKDMGANAVYFTGARPAADLLRLCDEMGFVVSPSPFGVEAFDHPRRRDASADVFSTGGDGLCDIAAYPKEAWHVRRAQWNADAPAVLLPHWNWPDGSTAHVLCAARADAAELFVNGESAGSKDIPPSGGAAGWDIPFEAGELKAIVYSGGEYAGETTLTTAGKPFRIKLVPEKQALADGESTFILVQAVDSEGNVNPVACADVSFSVEGPGEIVAAGNGAPEQGRFFDSKEPCPLYGGSCFVLARRTGGSGLPVVLTATSPQVRQAVLSVPRR